MSRTIYVNNFNRNRKELMVQGFGGKCQCCGYDRCLSALEFHHLDPKSKEITISRSMISWEKLLKELNKCICVCSNCHREIHSGIRKIDTSKKYFDERLVSEYSPIKEKIYDTCPVCGKKKLISKKFCSHKCSCKNQNRFDWDKIDLIDLIEKQKISITQIAKNTGVSWNAVKKRYMKLKSKIA